MTMGNPQAAVGAAWWGCNGGLSKLCSSAPEHSTSPTWSVRQRRSCHLATWLTGVEPGLAGQLFTAYLKLSRSITRSSKQKEHNPVLQAKVFMGFLRRTYDCGLSSNRAPRDRDLVRVQRKSPTEQKELEAKSEAIPKAAQPHRLLPSPDTLCHSLALAAALALASSKPKTRSTASHSRHHSHHRPLVSSSPLPSPCHLPAVPPRLGQSSGCWPHESHEVHDASTHRVCSRAKGPLWQFVPMCSFCLGLKS